PLALAFLRRGRPKTRPAGRRRWRVARIGSVLLVARPGRRRRWTGRTGRSDHTGARADDHDHSASFHDGFLLDRCDVQTPLDDLVQHGLAGLGVNDLASAKNDHQFALVTLAQEAMDVLELEGQVVLVGLGPKLYFLDDDRGL